MHIVKKDHIKNTETQHEPEIMKRLNVSHWKSSSTTVMTNDNAQYVYVPTGHKQKE